jgi:hypothetical protein
MKPLVMHFFMSFAKFQKTIVAQFTLFPFLALKMYHISFLGECMLCLLEPQWLQQCHKMNWIFIFELENCQSFFLTNAFIRAMYCLLQSKLKT